MILVHLRRQAAAFALVLCSLFQCDGKCTAAEVPALGGAGIGPLPCAIADALDAKSLGVFAAGIIAFAAVQQSWKRLTGQKDSEARTMTVEGQPIAVKMKKEFATREDVQAVDAKVEKLRTEMIPRSEIVTHHDLGKATAAIIGAGSEREGRIKQHNEDAIAKCFQLILDHEGKLGRHDGLLAAHFRNFTAPEKK